MPTTTLVTYDLDLTGLNPNNLVLNEHHNVSINARAFSLNYGPFFEKNLVVRRASDNSPLSPVDDYVVGVLYEDATIQSGKAVYCFIVINNLDIGAVNVTYQTIGGEFTRYTTAIAALLTQVALDDRPVEWGSLLGLPNGFTPAPHQHPITQIYNWGQMVTALDNLAQAIQVGNQAAMSEFYDTLAAEVSGSAIPIASVQEALAGADGVKRITSSLLKTVIDSRLAGFTVNDFDYVVDQEDQSWGYWRHRNSGFTVCWGTTTAVLSGNAYRVFFKRRFDFKPNIAGGVMNITTDATPTGIQWSELTASIADHTVAADGFYIATNRVSGTGNDAIRFNYIAVGYSSANAAIGTIPGAPAAIPPTGNAVAQPLWSGANGTSVQTDAVSSFRMGILLPSTVVGGGYTFNTGAMSAQSQFFYTNYPGLFTDSLYEIRGTITNTTYNPNMTYTGLTLGQWYDLATVKAMSPTALTSGYTWTTTGLYGGTTELTLDIRLKSDPLIIATRVFTFDRDSIALIPTLSGATSGTTDLYFNTSGGQSTRTISVAGSGSPNTAVFQFGNAQTLFTLLDYITADGNGISGSELANWDARLIWTAGNGFALSGVSLGTGTSLAANDGWYTLPALLALSNQWQIQTSTATSAVESRGMLEVRHHTDYRKFATRQFELVRAATDIIPVWSGTTAEVLTVPNGGGMVVFEIVFPTNQADGLGYISYSASSGVGQSTFTYAFGMGSFTDSNYSVQASNVVAVGSTLTNSNASLTAAQPMANGEVRYSWQGFVSQHTTLELDLTVFYNGLYATAGASTTQHFTLTVNVAA